MRNLMISFALWGLCLTSTLSAAEVLSREQFSVERFADAKVIYLDFWASWCGPCKMMAPAFKQVAAELATQVRFAKLETEAEQAVAARYNIRSIPTLILFKNGTEAARMSGALDANGLKRWLAQQT